MIRVSLGSSTSSPQSCVLLRLTKQVPSTAIQLVIATFFLPISIAGSRASQFLDISALWIEVLDFMDTTEYIPHPKD
jgi:hypothetical protein